MASTSYGNISNNYVFDVFINHRGPDCKKTLAKYLYDRLIKEGLRVFLDVNELQDGETITPQIQSAIRTASVHIAIFSPRYAESNWCLDELLLMFESGSTILPVFYGVKPSDLRWGTQSETGVYGQALKTLERKRTFDSQPRYDSNTIQKWRKALYDVAEIKGFDMETCNGDEQQLLQQVVEGVLKKVKRPLHVSRYPTGLDEKVQEFEGAVLLEQQSRETRVIGIVGLGGAGKTTLAKEIFNRRRSNYKQSCFLFDVRENVARNSLKSVQSMILSGLVQSNVQIDSTDDGIEKLKRNLSACHAFLILDDVDNVQQVEALLLPVKEVLHQGSLILVTSRNRDVLAYSGIVESSIFMLKGLDPDHSRELFCLHAFDQPDPLTEFEQVVRDFVDACAGLPLSLKVLGALLRGKTLEYGKAQLEKISKLLPEDILSRLKISYDGLDKVEKEIFLDIVCFFIGENKDTAIRIWDGTEWRGWLGLQNLQNRSLVEVDDRNRIRMHDHVRDLGRYIAVNEPPERTLRLSCPIHDLRYLPDKSLVRGISTVHSQGCERDQPLFKTLAEFADSRFRFRYYVRGLQLLRAKGNFEESIFSVANSLIWLCWVDFPYSCLPSCITLQNLRVLRIEGCKLETLWLHESQAPEQLRELYIMADFVKVPKSISKMTHLEKIAVVGKGLHVTFLDELCRLKSLKHLELGVEWPMGGFMSNLSNSFEMESLPDSFGSLTNLQSIAFFEFSDLQMLPESFGNLTNLRDINLGGCSSLQMLPDSFGNLTNLQSIDLSNCSSLQMLPDSFGNLTNLRDIKLSYCSSLQMLPDSFGNLTNLRNIFLVRYSSLQMLPDSFGNLTNLRYINLGWCSSLQMLPDSFGNLTKLRDIYLFKCSSLQMLPDSFGNLTNLQSIDLYECSSLQMLPDSFGNLTNLRDIKLSYCSSLQMLPDSFGNLTNLQSIDLSECSSLQMLPDSFGNLTNLEHIDLSECSSLQMLPDSFGNLTNLRDISLRGCSSLQMLRDSFGNLTNLQSIDLSECSSLQMLPDSFGNLTNLEHIDPSKCSSLQMLPDSFGNLTNLKFINLSECSSLQMLPDSFGNLTNLLDISVDGCSSLQMLPDLLGNLTNLSHINLSKCSSLQMLPDSFGNLTNLRNIPLRGCSSLQMLPDSFGNLTNLQLIDLSECSSLQMLPDSFGNLTNLPHIDLFECSSLQTLPDSFGNLTNLRLIELFECSSLQMLPDSFGNLTNLERISLGGCSSLQMLPDSFGNLTNLDNIFLSKCSSLKMLPHSIGKLVQMYSIDLSECCSLQMLPDSLGNLTNLTNINLIKCSSLKMLPDSIGKLVNLDSIKLSECSSLQMLPDSFGNLKNLRRIELFNCSSLQRLPNSFGNLIQLEQLKFDRVIVSGELLGRMITFKCSNRFFDWVKIFSDPFFDWNNFEVWPSQFSQLS